MPRSLRSALNSLRQRRTDYDLLDRLTGIIDAHGGTTGFGYDGDSNLLSVTDANNNTTGYMFDSRNRLTKRTDALTNSDSYAYDADGNLTQYTDRRGTVDRYTYDGLDRRTFAGFGWNGTSYASTITYTLDAILSHAAPLRPASLDCA